MRRISGSVIILLAVLATGAAAWWVGSADERRISECRDVGVQDQNRLARCARSPEARDAVLAEIREERHLELRRRVQVRLAEMRPTQVDTSRYEHLSIGTLQARGLDPHTVIYERSEVPAGIEDHRIAINGVMLLADLQKYSFDLTGDLSKDIDPKLFNIAADIEDLSRDEREFIRTVCTYSFPIDSSPGCPVMVYGQITFRSIFEDNWYDPWLEDQGMLAPVFRIEAVEFLDPPQP